MSSQTPNTPETPQHNVRVADTHEKVPVNGGFMILAKEGEMQELRKKMDRVAPTEFRVLLIGPTGTGKEKIARYIHEHSRRKDKPFVAINCGGKDANFIEDELFGHVRGGFTGADRPRTGRFEEAEGGTIFLDELDKMPPELQNKLLRVLNEKTYSRIGSNEEIKADVRIIAAVNRLVRKDPSGKKEPVLLSDLKHRLTQYPLRIPRLRDRPEDIPLLAEYFRDKATAMLGYTNPPRLPEESLTALKAYHWPGNVRDLENIMERATLDAGDGGTITLEVLNLPQGKHTAQVHQRRQDRPQGKIRSVEEIQDEMLKLAEAEGYTAKLQLANKLGIERSTFDRILKDKSKINANMLLGLAQICAESDDSSKCEKFTALFFELANAVDKSQKIAVE